jgi:hypothetical protein
MSRMGKLGEILDWVERFKLVIDVVVAIAGLKLVNQILVYIPQISSGWASAISWLSAAGILLGLLAWHRRRDITQENKRSTTQLATMESVKAFDEMEKFFQGYTSPIIEETEVNIRSRAEKYRGQERKNFLVTTCARLVTVSFSEQIWLLIFGSQLRALEEVNKQPVKIDFLKTYYDAGLQQRPDFYGNGKYSFASWLAFLKHWKLMIEDGDSIAITIRGREFLKYLVHTARYASEKAG